MSKKQQTEGQALEPDLEEVVSRYLRNEPDFFARHPGVLAEIRVPHHEAGRAISLIERQVGMLREKNHNLERELHDLVSIARQNDQVTARLHRFALAMLDAASFDDALSTAQDMLRQEFRVDAVAIRLTGGPDDRAARPGFVEPGDRRLEALFERTRAGRPLCGGALDGETLAYLFGGQAANIQSSALIAFGGGASGAAETVRGLLCLGSKDPRRFHSDMGTSFLTQLGELLLGGLVRHL